MILGGRYYTEKELKKCGFKSLGINVKIHNRASIYGAENITIGSNVRIDDFAVIIAKGTLQIGNFVSIHNYCYLGCKYGIILNDFVTLAPGVKIFSSSDDYSGRFLTGPIISAGMVMGDDKGKVVLKKHVIIGAGSIILPHCILGEGVSVGALSLVKTNLEPWGLYAGIPVKKIRERKKDLLKLGEKFIRTGKINKNK